MKPEEWKTFGLFAAGILALSFLDERIATTIVVITGIVVVLNHYRDAPSVTGTSGGGSGAGNGG